MAPIRVGIIGLSSGSDPSGDGWAASAHLPYLKTSPHYEIVALCNSSEASAKAAVKKHGLLDSTRTYGDSTELANDANIDLVVCAVRVDRHYKTIKASVEKGKNVYVEWPLGANLNVATLLLEAAEKSGSKTFVGLQARQDPYIRKVRELVQEGAIGDLISTTISVVTGMGGDSELPGTDYMAKKDIGGNLLTILAGHNLDWTIYALGDIEDFSAQLETRWPKSKSLNADGSFREMIDRDSADHINLHGTLAGSGATISFNLRGGKNIKDTPILTWRIFGTKGEIRITSLSPLLGIPSGAEKFELYDQEKDELKNITIEYPDVVKDLPTKARDIALLYEAYAAGQSEGVADFKEAVRVHQLIHDIYDSAEQKSWKSNIKH